MTDPHKVSWWRRGRVWRRILSDLAAIAVGGAAATISYSHIVYVAHFYGRQTWESYLYPVSIDGAMIVGVVAAADDRANGLRVRGWARIATWVGGLLSITAQVISAWPHGWIARGVATVPAGMLIVVVEVLARRGKPQRQRRAWWRRATVSPSATESEPVAVPAMTPVPVEVTPKPEVKGNGGQPYRHRPGPKPKDKGKPLPPKPEGPRRAPARTNYTGGGITDPDIDRALASVATRPAEVAPMFREPILAEIVSPVQDEETATTP